MTVEAIRVSPSWLDLREAADGRARARELVARLRDRIAVDSWLIHDLACGPVKCSRPSMPPSRTRRHRRSTKAASRSRLPTQWHCQ